MRGDELRGINIERGGTAHQAWLVRFEERERGRQQRRVPSAAAKRGYIEAGHFEQARAQLVIAYHVGECSQRERLGLDAGGARGRVHDGGDYPAPARGGRGAESLRAALGTAERAKDWRLGLAWVRVAEHAPYFETEDGASWTPIGANDSIDWPDLTPLFRRRDPAAVEAHLSTCASTA